MKPNAAKSVFITGASSGIGRASVTRLAKAGFRVFAGVRKESDAVALRADNPKIVPITIDVADAASIQSAKRAIEEQVGALDGLVNNAGIGISAPIEYVALDVLRYQFEVNVFGQIAVTQALLPLIHRAHGRIVDMGSVGAHITIPFGGLLCASKSAFRAINDALRLELRPFGIRVILIEPARIRTPAVDKTLGDVERNIQALPPEGQARYGAMMREFTRRANEREVHGSSPDVVADAVHTALTAKRPRTRYLVGKDARLMTTLPRLPDRLRDRILFRAFGMPAGRLQSSA